MDDAMIHETRISRALRRFILKCNFCNYLQKHSRVIIFSVVTISIFYYNQSLEYHSFSIQYLIINILRLATDVNRDVFCTHMAFP